MLQVKPCKIPALLKRNLKSNQQSEVEFTKEELQFLKVVVKSAIKEDYAEYVVCKDIACRMWEDCDPNDRLTEDDFKLMKKVLTVKDKLASRIKKLENIQRKIKKQLRMGGV